MDFTTNFQKFALGAMIVCTFLCVAGSAIAYGQAATGSKPNILFIMGDDIGIMSVGVYHRG